MPDAFDDVYATYGQAVHAYLVRLTGNVSAAEELCQETFLRFLRHQQALAGSNGSLKPWLFRVATNLGIDRLRRRRHRDARPPQEDGASVERLDSAEARELAQRIEAEVLALAPDLRATFLLRAHHGLTHAQVGEALGISERAAKSRFRRTRVLLTQRLAPYLEEDLA